MCKWLVFATLHLFRKFIKITYYKYVKRVVGIGETAEVLHICNHIY